MKSINTLNFLILIFILSACKEDPVFNPVISGITSLSLSVSKDRILGDGIDSASIIVVNQYGSDVKNLVNLYINDIPYTRKVFQSTTSSVSVIYAKFEKVKSNEDTVLVIEDKNLKFEKNVLLEQYTGTWCGYCPRAIGQIENLQQSDKKIVHIALHLSDAMSFSLNSSLFQSFGFTGVPTVHADRSSQWNGNNSAIAYLHSPVRAGMAVKVNGSGSNVSAQIKVKFGYDFPEDLKLSVYLLDDGLIANQANYYNSDPSSPYYQMGTTMTNFVHKNVLIKIGTDMFGDAIPSDSIGIGTTYSNTYNFSGINPDHLSRIKVAAFLTYASGTNVRKVLNSVIGTVGDNKDFVTVVY